jgi:hypothetical protein
MACAKQRGATRLDLPRAFEEVLMGFYALQGRIKRSTLRPPILIVPGKRRHGFVFVRIRTRRPYTFENEFCLIDQRESFKRGIDALLLDLLPLPPTV